MRVGLILAATFFVLSSSATILAFTSGGGDGSTPAEPAVSNQAPAETSSNAMMACANHVEDLI